MFIVFTGFFGLIGYTYYFTLPCFLIGCNFAYHLLNWPDPSIAILHRKMWLVIYLIIGLIYFFIFFNIEWKQKMSSYFSTFCVKIYYILGNINDIYIWVTERW